MTLPVTGKSYDVAKVLDPQSRTLYRVSLDPNGGVVDEGKLDGAERAAKRTIQGAFGDSDYVTLLGAAPDASYSIDAWGHLYLPARPTALDVAGRLGWQAAD